MNILYLFDADTSDRAESAMIISLSKRGVRPLVACTPDTPFEATLQAAGLETVPVRFGKKVDLQAIQALRSLLKNRSIDLVHVFHKKALINYTLATIGIRKPTVAYRGIIGNLSYFDPFSWLSFLNPRIDRLICVCEAIRQYFINKPFLLIGHLIRPEKVVTIYKGHDTDWYTQPKRADLGDLGVERGAFIIGCVARMKARKGIRYLIRAMEQIQSDRPVHLLLIGPIEDKGLPELIAQSPVKERIHLLGFRKDVARLASGFDIITLPSLRREGLPRAIIEGMSQGLPALVTHSGGSPELVRDEVEGRVVPTHDARALARAIEWFMADEERTRHIGRQAKRRIEERFNLEQTAEQTLQLYREVLQKETL